MQMPVGNMIGMDPPEHNAYRRLVSPSFSASAVRKMEPTVREIVNRVRTTTGMAPVAVDLARTEFGIPVVFVVAPGLGVQPPERR